MTSPFRRHQQQVRAQLAAGIANSPEGAPAIDDSNPASTEYRQLLTALHDDQRTLAQIQSIDARNPKKAQMILAYLPWVTGALEAGAGDQGSAMQDEIVATMLVWHCDLGQWAEAIDLADHMIRHAVALPERFKRPPATFLVDRAAEAAKVDPASIDLATLQAISALTATIDMPDQARAALLRAIGLAQSAAADAFDPAAENAVAGGKAALIEAALVSLTEAVRLNANVGVKKQLDALKVQHRKLADEAAAAAGASN